MHRHLYIIIIMWLLSTVLFVSCQEALFYSHYEHVSCKGWNNCDTLVFDIPQTEEDETFSLQLCVRTTDSYEYNSIAFTTEVLADSIPVAYDTIHINIYDEKGNSRGIGFPYTEIASEPKIITLNAGKNYQIRITHAMRLNPLPNVTEAGITLQRLAQQTSHVNSVESDKS